jgi:hypothetical protein
MEAFTNPSFHPGTGTVTIVWTCIATTSALLVGINAITFVWQRDYRRALVHVTLAISMVATASLELMMMRCEDPAFFGQLHRWYHLAIWGCFMTMAALGPAYFKWGSLRLLLSACFLRTISLALNFLSPVSANYLEITDIRKVPFLGDQVSIPVGVTNPWMIIGQIGFLFALAYMMQACISGWRHNKKKYARAVPLTITLLFVL